MIKWISFLQTIIISNFHFAQKRDKIIESQNFKVGRNSIQDNSLFSKKNNAGFPPIPTDKQLRIYLEEPRHDTHNKLAKVSGIPHPTNQRTGSRCYKEIQPCCKAKRRRKKNYNMTSLSKINQTKFDLAWKLICKTKMNVPSVKRMRRIMYYNQMLNKIAKCFPGILKNSHIKCTSKTSCSVFSHNNVK